MSYFETRPFKRSQYIAYNTEWIKRQIFKSKPSQSLRNSLLNTLKNSGFKREFIDIDNIGSITPRGFLRNYYLKNKPVIIKNFSKNWPCMQWDFDFFKSYHGDHDTINTNIGEMEVISLSETIDRIRANKSHNARICTLLTHNKQLLRQSNLHLLKPLLPKVAFRTSDQFFIGTKGNFTPLHAGGTNNYQVQVSGKKIWHLIDPMFNPVIHPIVDGEPLFKSKLNTDEPNFDLYPELKYIPILRANLEPGDLLFNPTFYWHQVQYLSESIAIGLRSLSPYSVFKSSPTMFFVMATATNPSALKSLLTITRGETAPFFK